MAGIPLGFPVFHELEVCHVASDDHKQVDDCAIVTRFCHDDQLHRFSVGLRHPNEGFFRMAYRATLSDIIQARNVMIEARRKELGFA